VQVYCEPGQNIPRGDTAAQELSQATASLVGCEILFSSATGGVSATRRGSQNEEK
jgi:hypothetical protein